MKSMMKRVIFCFMILLLLGGCAGQFKEQRNLSRPLVALGMSKIQENDIQGAHQRAAQGQKCKPR